MEVKRQILRHFLAALAYRTQKALRDGPDGFADFRADEFVRTPHELLLHMTGVLKYALTLWEGGDSWPNKMPTFREEVLRFHETLEGLGRHLDTDTPPGEATYEQLLQGPFSDAMTHAGQIALLRRLYGSPVPGEGFMLADIDPQNLSANQPDPVRPDKEPIKPGQEGDANK